MFIFSTKTEVNKQFKLSDLFKQIGAGKEIKKDALCIESVVLKNVISPRTLNCEPDKTIKEIYVFEIRVRTQTIPELFIKELDKNIKLHTLFNVKYGESEYSLISYKLGTASGKYWHTNWQPEEDYDVPLVNTVPEMYKYILSKFFKYPPHEAENVSGYIKRYNALVKLDFQINKTQSAIAYETQSKRKFEYNARLKQYKEDREKLLNGEE